MIISKTGKRKKRGGIERGKEGRKKSLMGKKKKTNHYTLIK